MSREEAEFEAKFTAAEADMRSSAAMAEVILLHCSIDTDENGQYCRDCNYRYGYGAERTVLREASNHVAEQLAAAGFGKLGFEGGIWTMTDAELKAQLETTRIEAAAAVANAVRNPLIDLVNALEFTATGKATERAAGG